MLTDHGANTVQRKAALEHTKRPQSPLLALGKQPVAPLKRRRQRSMPPRRVTPTRRKLREALGKLAVHFAEAKSRRSCRHHLEGKGDAVEANAKLPHDRQFVDSNSLALRFIAVDEEHFGGRKTAFESCFEAERREPEDVLPAQPQRHLRGRDDPQLRGFGKQGTDNVGNGVGNVLAIVENKQPGQWPQHIDDGEQWGGFGSDRNAEDLHDRTLDEAAVGHGRQVDNPDTVWKAAGEFLGGFEGQRRLADAARAQGRNQWILVDEFHEASDFVVAPDAFRSVARQIATGANGRRHALLDARGRWANIPIATAMDGRDEVRAEGFPERGHMHVKGVFFDDRARPEKIEQVALLDQHIGALKKHEQQVDAARAEFNRTLRTVQRTLPLVQHEIAEGQRHRQS
ncbi:hypothetical protein [Mesorhizobium sp. M1E.F.Ca.ET.063.01.1.1]|uniref:hypothetical protein n=1 Tax=Mesorhizobium sp. M1E.F.Ca.ET.063.01.1.1 TaxID=2496750 RepID=UPI001FDF195F|nr:hypothetical protein [Mesorhizobium sp. M1E.F.Ca.ET.063.01.1.1]